MSSLLASLGQASCRGLCARSSAAVCICNSRRVHNHATQISFTLLTVLTVCWRCGPGYSSTQVVAVEEKHSIHYCTVFYLSFFLFGLHEYSCYVLLMCVGRSRKGSGWIRMSFKCWEACVPVYGFCATFQKSMTRAQYVYSIMLALTDKSNFPPDRRSWPVELREWQAQRLDIKSYCYMCILHFHNNLFHMS